MHSPLRLGVAGLGFGAAVHVPGFRSLDGVEIVAIAGNTVAGARRTADATGIPAGVGGYENLLDFHLDAVSIALPPKENAAAAEFFLKRGIPVLCEKPIASDIINASRLEELSHCVPHAVDFQFAELPAFCAARSAIQGGRIGRVKHIQTTWLCESYANRHQINSWKRETMSAGGILSLFCSHIFYLVAWLVSSISTISVKLSTDGKMWEPHMAISPDTFQGWSELQSGATASFIVSNAALGRTIHRWEIIGDKGAIIIENKSKDYMAHFSYILADRNGKHTVNCEYADVYVDGRISAFASLANRFISAVREDTQTYPNFSDGRRVQNEIDAAIESNSSRQIVEMSKYEKAI